MLYKVAIILNEVPIALSLSDKINLFLAIVSTSLAFISIIFVIITIKQNSKMIESTSRPYIVIKYETMILPSETSRYIVVKNYGQSIATDIEINCSGDADQSFLDRIHLLNGTCLAPGQRVIYYFGDENPKTPEKLFFCYSYKGTRKRRYQESITLQMIVGRYSFRAKDNKENKAISYALQELTERFL